MQSVRLILSFDHELSLGGTGSFDYNLFAPTYELLALSAEIGVPIALFTDILCALRYREQDPDGFFKPYCRQLEAALRGGHDVQLHIHPHWIDSTWVDGVYQPSSHFALSDFEKTAPPDDIRGIVRRAFTFLTELCLAYDPVYRCIAYRAGGHNLWPATAIILSSLYESGIRIDSSIVKNFRFRSNISAVDFRAMPDSANWFIPVSGPLNAQSDSGIFEVPIASKARTPLNNVPFLARRLVHGKRGRNPRGHSIHSAHTPLLQKAARLFPRSAWPLGFDDAAQSVDELMSIFRAYLHAHPRDEEIICAAVSHPKSMGKYELSLMRSFVDRVRQEFGETVRFTTYEAVFAQMGDQEPRSSVGQAS